MIIGVGILALCLLYLLVFSGSRNEINNISGRFEKITNHSDPMTCYCNDFGYLYFDSEEIPVCFLETQEIGCTEINLTGGFNVTNRVLNTPNNTCPTGDVRIFYASSYECLNEERNNLSMDMNNSN